MFAVKVLWCLIFRALVVGHRAAQLAIEAVEDLGEGLSGDVCLAARQLDQSDEQGGAIDQRTDLGEIALADNQVAFPMARNEAHLDFDGPLIDESHVWDGGLAASFFATLRSSGVVVSTAHQDKQAGAQLPPRHGVERGADGLVRDPHRIGHTSQCARNLRWAQALAEMIDNDNPERVAGDQFFNDAWPGRQHAGSPVGQNASIAPGNPDPASMNILRLPTVPVHFAGYSGTGPHEAGGDRRWPHAQPQLRLNQSPFLNIKVTVAFRHMRLSPVSEMLHLELESAVLLMLLRVSQRALEEHSLGEVLALGDAS